MATFDILGNNMMLERRALKNVFKQNNFGFPVSVMLSVFNITGITDGKHLYSQDFIDSPKWLGVSWNLLLFTLIYWRECVLVDLYSIYT